MLSPSNKTKRVAEVGRILVRHGFADFISGSRLASVVGKTRGSQHESADDGDGAAPAREERVRLVLEELGTTFIKLGQILSTRPDLIPDELATELKKLQSDTPKVEFAAIQQTLLESFPDGTEALFESIEEEPLASASIAQAHRGKLKDGTPVVLKIIRPGVDETVRGDIEVLQHLAELLKDQSEKLGFNPVEVVDEFARNMESELDFMQEGRATDRLARYFTDEDGIGFPKVYWECTTKKVLTLEEIEGAPISKLDLDQLGPETRRKACSLGLSAVFKMCLEFGTFHADPHPGNIFVHPDGSITFIDCGMTGHIESRTRYQLGQLVRAVVDGNLDHTIRVAIEITDADPGLERDRKFRGDAWELISRFETDTIEGLDITALLSQFSDLLRKYRLHCPSDLVYLIKALLTVEGVAEQLDPSLDIMEEVKPLLKRMLAKQYGISAVKERLTRSLVGYVEILEEFPKELRELFIQLRRKGYGLKLQLEQIDELQDTLINASRLVSTALILSAMLVSSALLIHSESGKGPFTTIGSVTLGVALCFTAAMAIGAWRRRKKK